MLRLLFVLIISLLSVALSYAPHQHAYLLPSLQQIGVGPQQIIVFLQAQDSFFRRNSLPKLEKLANDKKMTLVVKDASEGIPEELTSTPAIIYRNGMGKSIYAARYAEFATIENFIRTSRAVPQQRVLNCKQQMLLYKEGRMKVASPVKITALNGTKPATFDEEGFQAKASAAIDKGMANFGVAAEACLMKTDRSFYIDFHPFRSADNKIFLSFELYSQFSCITPVFSSMSTPLSGDFNDFEAVFAQASAILEKEIFQQMQESEIGDAVTPIGESIERVSLEELGLVLPEVERVQVSSAAMTTALPQKWMVAGPVDPEIPMLQFRFMEPLERYAGEMASFVGTLQTAADGQVSEGFFEVSTASMTMGMADLDQKVRKKYIYTNKFPKASFRFTLVPEGTRLKWGETTSTDILGAFELMKIEQAVMVKADLTPTIGPNGEALLAVQASFALNITENFGIEGPDGPKPAKETLLFNLNFFMKQSL